VEDIDFWMNFVVKISLKLQILVLGRKINLASTVFTLLNFEIFNLKMWIIKNVFTLGPTTQATLMLHEI